LGIQRNHPVRSAQLSAEKASVYETSARELAESYTFFTVAVSEGLELRNAGELWAARSAARLCEQVVERHGPSLSNLLAALEKRSRHFVLLPDVDPLSVEDFETQEARSYCFWNGWLSHVFGLRMRWFHKVQMLREILAGVERMILDTARELADGVSVSPVADWDTLATAYGDWHTCLRESANLLQELLATLAPKEVQQLRRELEKHRKS